MFKIDDDMTINVTRGDCGTIDVSATVDGAVYVFLPGDILRLKVFEKKNCENVVLKKDFGIEVNATTVTLTLTGKDTKFGGLINKPTNYWYEIELNPETNPQTIVGYDDDGPKLFCLHPEGNEVEETEPDEADVGAFDDKLDLTSNKALPNWVIAQEFYSLQGKVSQYPTDVISVGSWGIVGDGKTDVTDKINAIFESLKGGETVYFPKGTYLVSRSGTKNINDVCVNVVGKNNIRIEFSKGATIKCALDDSNKAADFGILYITDCNNIEITGGIIEGEGDDHQKGLDVYHDGLNRGLTCEQAKALEGAIAPYYIASKDTYYDMNGGINGIIVRDCNDVYIHNMTIHNCFGDGILASTKTNASPQMKNFITENCTIYNCKRNGIAYEGILNGIIRNCSISNIKGHNPQAGIDLESEKAQNNENILIEGCQIYDCGLKAIVQSTRTYDVTVLNCKSDSPFIVGDKPGDNLHLKNSTFSNANLVHNCKVDNCKFNTIGIYSHRYDGVYDEYTNVEFNNCEILGSATTYSVLMQQKIGKAVFNNCKMHFLSPEDGNYNHLIKLSSLQSQPNVVFNGCDFLVSNIVYPIMEIGKTIDYSVDFIKCNFMATETTITKNLFTIWGKSIRFLNCVFDFRKVTASSELFGNAVVTLRTPADGVLSFANNSFLQNTIVAQYFLHTKENEGSIYVCNNFAPSISQICNPNEVAGAIKAYGNVTSETLEASE